MIPEIHQTCCDRGLVLESHGHDKMKLASLEAVVRFRGGTVKPFCYEVCQTRQKLARHFCAVVCSCVWRKTQIILLLTVGWEPIMQNAFKSAENVVHRVQDAGSSNIWRHRWRRITVVFEPTAFGDLGHASNSADLLVDGLESLDELLAVDALCAGRQRRCGCIKKTIPCDVWSCAP